MDREQAPLDVARRKAEMRARGRAARAAVAPGARRAAGRAVTEHLDRIVGREGLALGYMATPAELPLEEWMARRLDGGGRLALPRVAGPALEVVEVTDLSASLAPGWRGLREPAGPPVAPRELTVLVLPGTAFDDRGRRLGQGGGHLDRLIARVPSDVLLVGVCYASQVVDEVPQEPHDRGVHVVLTERGLAADLR